MALAAEEGATCDSASPPSVARAPLTAVVDAWGVRHCPRLVLPLLCLLVQLLLLPL